MVSCISGTKLSNLLIPFLFLFICFLFCFVSPVTFSDCKGNNKLHYEVSSPYFKVNNDGSLVALKNITAVGKTLFVHARTPHAEDMAELVIVGGKDVQGSLQVTAVWDKLGPQRNIGSVCLMWKIVLWFITDQGIFVVANDKNPTQKTMEGVCESLLANVTDIWGITLPSGKAMYPCPNKTSTLILTHFMVLSSFCWLCC